MNIIVIDDHELFREGVKLVLEKIDDNCKVYSVESGIEALSLIESDIDFDVIMLDYNLPKITGVDTLKRLKNAAPEIPVVMLSSEECPKRIREALSAGANGFITKNSTADVTISAVKLVLSGGMYLPSQLLLNEQSTDTEKVQYFEKKEESQTRNSSSPKPNQLTLTTRQLDVLVQMNNGLANKEIARHLNMSPSTVKVHVTAIFRELGVKNRVQAINLAKEYELIQN